MSRHRRRLAPFTRARRSKLAAPNHLGWLFDDIETCAFMWNVVGRRQPVVLPSDQCETRID
jgi:hypothetical protein